MAKPSPRISLLKKTRVDEFIEKLWSERSKASHGNFQELMDSMGYSLLNGGKRFRPLLCLMTAEAFGVHPNRILPWAAAVEMVHTYSLIHDDLPCMDDDDLRRGQPTNHKKFGEATALLAGDALLTEAFFTIAKNYQDMKLTELLAEAAGAFGMVGGQVMDLAAKGTAMTTEQILRVHQLKTGALIRVCAEGSAVICGLPAEKVQLCREFGENLGLAFQLKDDLLDEENEKSEIEAQLAKVSNAALESLKKLEITSGELSDLIQYNQTRSQ